MLLRKQDALANFAAIRQAVGGYDPYARRTANGNGYSDAVRQFGVAAAEEVVALASQCVRESVVVRLELAAMSLGAARGKISSAFTSVLVRLDLEN